MAEAQKSSASEVEAAAEKNVFLDHLRRVVQFTARHKCFLSEPGPFNNVYILNELLRYSKYNKRMVAAQLDIVQELDMILHIIGTLRRKGIPGL